MSDQGGDSGCWAHLFDERDGEAKSVRGGLVVNLGEVKERGNGAVWNLPHGGDLDANLVRLEPYASIDEHINDEVDVLVFVQSGTASLHLEDDRVDLASDHLALISKGARRSITAGPTGITYLSVHRRRGPLSIARSEPSDV